MINTILIILVIALYMALVFLVAWYVGSLIHYCMNDEKEVEQHDHDA